MSGDTASLRPLLLLLEEEELLLEEEDEDEEPEPARLASSSSFVSRVSISFCSTPKGRSVTIDTMREKKKKKKKEMRFQESFDGGVRSVDWICQSKWHPFLLFQTNKTTKGCTESHHHTDKQRRATPTNQPMNPLTLDQEGVVAAFAQLHLDVHELGHGRSLERLHEEPVVVLEDRAVVLLLHGGELHVDDGLFLGGDVLRDVLFHAPQQVRGDAPLQGLHLVLRGDVAVPKGSNVGGEVEVGQCQGRGGTGTGLRYC